MLTAIRAIVAKSVHGMSEEQLTTVVPGRSNHILWNIGHMLTVQLLLVHKLAGLELLIPAEWPAYFGKDTGPQTWDAGAPSVSDVISRVESLAAEHAAVLASDPVIDFTPYTTGFGAVLATIDDAIAFNNFHEGVHTGIILSIKRSLTTA